MSQPRARGRTRASRPTPAERRLVDRLNTPARVQAWLNELPYNREPNGATQRSFRGVVRSGVAHCMEAAVSAAAILEPHGYPPLVMSLESIDRLDHVVFVYRSRRTGRWGSIGRSRDIGLNGRRAVFGTLRALARSYMDHYVDDTGRITGYGVANLADAMGGYDWRLATGNIWAVERMLIDLPHTPLPSSDARYRRLRARYRAYRAAHDGAKPTVSPLPATWSPLPRAFRRRGRITGVGR